MFERIEKALFAIRSVILNDEEIRKLIYNTEFNPLAGELPSIEDTLPYVTMKPFLTFDNEEGYTRNVELNIYVALGSSEDDVASAAVRINIVVNRDKWEIKDAIRPLRIADKIVDLLDMETHITSNPLMFHSVTELVVDDKLAGYSVLFDIADGIATINKF